MTCDIIWQEWHIIWRVHVMWHDNHNMIGMSQILNQWSSSKSFSTLFFFRHASYHVHIYIQDMWYVTWHVTCHDMSWHVTWHDMWHDKHDMIWPAKSILLTIMNCFLIILIKIKRIIHTLYKWRYVTCHVTWHAWHVSWHTWHVTWQTWPVTCSVIWQDLIRHV